MSATTTKSAYDESILRSLRRISRAIGLHSRQLATRYHLTTPQMVCLRHVAAGPCTPGELAQAVALSPPTVTGILDRLQDRGLLIRTRHDRDKRKLLVTITAQGRDMLKEAPLPLQERFAANLARSSPEEQAEIDRVLRKVVEMMEAEHLEAAPLLDSSPYPLDGGRT